MGRAKVDITTNYRTRPQDIVIRNDATPREPASCDCDDCAERAALLLSDFVYGLMLGAALGVAIGVGVGRLIWGLA